MRLHLEVALYILYHISFTNRGWQTWEVERGSRTYVVGYSYDQKVADD